jgi:hypothetical protein
MLSCKNLEEVSSFSHKCNTNFIQNLDHFIATAGAALTLTRDKELTVLMSIYANGLQKHSYNLFLLL